MRERSGAQAASSSPRACRPWSPHRAYSTGRHPTPVLSGSRHRRGGAGFLELAEHVGRDQPIFGLAAAPSGSGVLLDGRDRSPRPTSRPFARWIRAVRTASAVIPAAAAGSRTKWRSSSTPRAHGSGPRGYARLPKRRGPAPQRADAGRPVANAQERRVLDGGRRFLHRASSSGPPPPARSSRIRTFGDSVDIRDRLGVWRFPESTRAVLEAHYRMLLAYRPRPYPGADYRPPRPDGQAVISWHARSWLGALAQGGVRLHVIPGAHDNILTEPRVSGLAAALVESLNGA